MPTLQRVFLTGASGFIGSHIARHLLDQGIAVRALIRPQSISPALAGLDIELVPGDLLAPGPWLERLHGCDALFHVAALYSPRPEDAPTLYAVNVGGTQMLLEAAAAAGGGRVVHTSTIGTIGRPADGGLPDETTPFNLWPMASNYVRSKWLGEAAALWWNQRGLPVVVVHPTGPVGAGDHKPTATGQRIVDFLAGRRPDYPGSGLNLCPVADIAAGHILAARYGRPGQRYILGHRAGNLDEDAFLALLSQVSGRPVPPAVERRRGRRPLSLTANPGRAIRELGLPQSDLETAFSEAVSYYRDRS